MKVELLTSHTELLHLERRWEELAALDRRDGFFRTPRWYHAWMRHIRPDARPFVPVVLEDDGSVIGLAPLCLLKFRDLGFSLDAVSWGGREVVSGDYLDVVAPQEQKSEVCRAILEFLWRHSSRWNLLALGELLEDSDVYRAVETFGKRAGVELHRQEERICPYIALPDNFDTYLRTLSSSTRYNIRRRMREVEKQGGCVTCHTLPHELQTHLDTLIRLHLARWRQQHLPGTLSRPGFREFLLDICGAPCQVHQVRLYLLCQDGQAVAALLAFAFGDSLLYYQAGWDPSSPLASHSPALVLMAQSIRDANAHKMVYYDFLRGDESYKSHWTKTYRTTATLLTARTWLAKEYLRFLRTKDRFKELIAAYCSHKAMQRPIGNSAHRPIEG
ncbi:MAG: GNAT family N-acetyltransferase [Anaerolineales bacterium]|nr:GNAT family N-acetyltransferase [Anaerolineales bacterium]